MNAKLLIDGKSEPIHSAEGDSDCVSIDLETPTSLAKVKEPSSCSFMYEQLSLKRTSRSVRNWATWDDV